MALWEMICELRRHVLVWNGHANRDAVNGNSSLDSGTQGMPVFAKHVLVNTPDRLTVAAIARQEDTRAWRRARSWWWLQRWALWQLPQLAVVGAFAGFVVWLWVR